MKLRANNILNEQDHREVTLEISDNYDAISYDEVLYDLYCQISHYFGFNVFKQDKIFVDSKNKIVSYEKIGLIKALLNLETITIKFVDNISNPQFIIQIELIKE